MKDQMNTKHFLALSSGEIFYGQSCGASVDMLGEAVFNTGMTGYQEIISDPSYFGQFVALSTAEVGNYGCNSEDWESDQLYLSGLIVQQMNQASNFRTEEELTDVLKRYNKPSLTKVDTRRLVLYLRKYGTQKAFLHASDEPITPEMAVAKAQEWEGLDQQDSAAKVSCPDIWFWDEKQIDKRNKADYSTNLAKNVLSINNVSNQKMNGTIVVYDFGIKRNILRSLASLGFKLVIVPSFMTAQDALNLKPDGVFLSNGPGDPSAVKGAIEAARELLGKVPLMGICLGHQILSIASGAQCERLKFGHHGCNHPVKNLQNGSIAITSQNHNFAVRPESIPQSLEITHINLNDQTVEGIRHKKYPMFGVQYHPEAAPGPHDAQTLFGEFIKML